MTESTTYWREHGDRLRLTRLALDISEQEAAATYGVKLPTYRKWECGGRLRDSWRTINGYRAFSKKYGVSLDWLVLGRAEHVGRSIAAGAPGRVAVLRVVTAEQRRQKAAAEDAMAAFKRAWLRE